MSSDSKSKPEHKYLIFLLFIIFSLYYYYKNCSVKRNDISCHTGQKEMNE